MIQALAAILGAALTAAACYASGCFLIDRLRVKLNRFERLPLAFVLGAACLHLAVFAILLLHLEYWPILVVLLIAPIAFQWRAGFPVFGSAGRESVPNVPGSPGEASAAPSPIGGQSRPLEKLLKIALPILFAAFSVLYFFHALAPEASPDGASYHLGFVARYLHARGFERITTDMYAAFGEGIEMVFTPAFAIGRHSAAALVQFTFLIALAMAVFAYGRRLGKPWAGAAAAFLVYASPVVGMDGTTAYIDVAVAAVVFSVFYWLEIWDEVRDERLLIPAGLLAGYAYAAKYTAFVILVYAIGFVWWRARSLRPALKVSAFSLAMAGPWLLKNWIVLHNPVAPFANQFFRNPYFHPLAIQQWAEYLRRYELVNLWSLPLEVMVRGAKTNGVIGPVFLLLPIVLLSLRFRAGRRLLAAGSILLATYLANVGTRFLIPELPFFALALALAPGDSPGLIASMVLFHALTSWPAGVNQYAPGSWSLSDRVRVREALRIVPQDAYLRRQNPAYGMARLVEDHVPKGERVLGFTGVAESYISREVLVDYHSAFNNGLTDIFNVGWLHSYQPRVLERIDFSEKTARRIRVDQNALGRPAEQWSVHELRFFHQGTEIPRRPQWRLSAWPNPWDVQLAFDNSPATRWRTWERAAPGDHIEVDFGRPEAVDEVRVETSYDHNLQAAVEAFDDASGRWTAIAGHRQTAVLKPDGNIRRYSTREIALRGIHYVLIPDEYQGFLDVRGDPEGWGLALVAEGYGVHLYRIVS